MSNFNVKIKKYYFELLEPEIDIILKCMEYYMYNEYSLKNKKITEEQNLERNLIKDTYDQLLLFKKKNTNKKENIIKNNFKKFA